MSRMLKTTTLAATVASWLICGARTPVTAGIAAPATPPAPAARRLMIEAAALEAGGNASAASRKYVQVIDICGGAGDVALQARGRLVPLLLNTTPLSPSQIQEQLDAMR